MTTVLRTLQGETLSKDLLLDQFDTIIFDCDGVLWSGEKVIDGAIELVQLLKENNKNVFFVTNNSSASRGMYVKKFEKKGFKQVALEDILSSSFAAAHYLSTNGFTGKVYVVGEQGIYIELDELLIETVNDENTHVNFPHTNVVRGTSTPLKVDLNLEDNVKAVVVGFDRYFNYLKLSYAYKYLQDPNCLFIATNTDRTFPAEDGDLPGTGSFIKTIEEATQRKPIVVGKPSMLLMDIIRSRVSLDCSRTLMVGDRLDTDIAFGKEAGIKTLLVLSGVTPKESLLTNDIVPDYILDSVANLVQ